MKNKTLKYIVGTLFLMMFVTLTSCDEVEDPDAGGTLVEAMAGDWYVQLNGTGSYYHISTYNTAANDGQEMWIDDMENFWTFKAKTPVVLNGLTFAGSNLASKVLVDDDPIEYYEITVSITNGKVTKGDIITPAGNPTDGISFDIEFSDDPGEIYTLSGYKRTGFAADEH